MNFWKRGLNFIMSCVWADSLNCLTLECVRINSATCFERLAWHCLVLAISSSVRKSPFQSSINDKAIKKAQNASGARTVENIRPTHKKHCALPYEGHQKPNWSFPIKGKPKWLFCQNPIERNGICLMGQLKFFIIFLPCYKK